MELHNYIPISYIKQERNREIRKLPLPEDIINKIINYNDEFIKPDNNIDDYWINLGIETCNLYNWSRYCHSILVTSFGSTKFNFLYNMIQEYFGTLRSYLDDIVCGNYPKNINSIQNVLITNIFLHNPNIIEYPTRNSDKLRKYITKDEKKYIMTFIKRINVYLKYIENNIDILFLINLKFYNSTNKEIANRKKDIIKEVLKIKKRCDKLTIMMNNIEVME